MVETKGFNQNNLGRIVTAPKRVLIVDGPAVGTWVTIPMSEFKVVIPNPDNWKIPLTEYLDDTPKEPREINFNQLEYNVEQVGLFHGYKVWVATLDSRDPDFLNNVLHAILQRDVVKEIGLL